MSDHLDSGRGLYKWCLESLGFVACFQNMRSAAGQQAPGAFDLSGVLGERGHACYSVCIIFCICETISLAISINIYFYQSHKSTQLGGRTRLDQP